MFFSSRTCVKTDTTTIKLPLPCTLNKYFDFTFIDAMSFKSRWKIIGNENVLMSKSLTMNKTLLSNPQDLKTFLPGLIDLNIVRKPGNYSPYSKSNNFDIESRKVRLGAVFSLSREERFLLKVTVSYDEKIQFFIGKEGLNQQAETLRLAELLIHTFSFIFCELF
jgi:hypothetical protein